MRIRNGFKIKVEEKRMNREKFYGNVKSDVKCPTFLPMSTSNSENPQGSVPGFDGCKQCDDSN